MKDLSFGYNDPAVVNSRSRWGFGKAASLVLALLIIVAFWLALDYKLLAGKDWMSDTYDNPDWRTNEGNLHTYGAWDLETHIWKTTYIMQNFPNFQWNPYWYLGMPLLKYYQLGFYFVNMLTVFATGFSVAKSALMMVIFGHLLATILTFILCYKVSGRIWASAFSSLFLLTNTFLSLRSYGWEPITVVFLFLYPLGLLFFLREPLRPFRLSLVLILAAAYLSHPLLWFSLNMTIGLYLVLIALKSDRRALNTRYIWEFIALVAASIAVGAVQFLPQLSYRQVTSGAHMGVTYLPYYQVPYNIITIVDFLFDAGNLKGPGPIVMIALLLFFAFLLWQRKSKHSNTIYNNTFVQGIALVLLVMIIFYYMELYSIFPMNFLRSIQYHRIIPEFVIAAAVLVAAFGNTLHTSRQKVFYYSMLIGFVLASSIIIYNVQAKWVTTSEINTKPEFIQDNFLGRISFPYTDQSLAVRSSFTDTPETYGYYEQGITNPYDDELFSVSSGFQSTDSTITYLKAADVARLYINTEEGEKDKIMMYRLNGTLKYVDTGARYSYFEVPIKDPSFSQAVDSTRAEQVKQLEPRCRVLFKVQYCGSTGEEFVDKDPSEIKYLKEYVGMLEEDYPAKASFSMIDPDHYRIDVSNAQESTDVVVKMTYDKDFTATANGKKIPIEPIGPYFMLLKPGTAGSYEIQLTYNTSMPVKVGAIISVASLIGLMLFFIIRRFVRMPSFFGFSKGDM